MKRRDIPRYIEDELFVSAWSEWRRWKRFGLPKGSGWRSELPRWLRAVELLEQECDYHRERELEERREGER